MNIITATENTLASLVNFLEQVDAATYRQPIDLFKGSTLGEHTRHVVEFYQCIQRYNHTGCINYDKRERDRMIQQDPEMALLSIRSILDDLKTMNMDREVILEVGYDKNSDDVDTVVSNIKREIAYNLEHAIHHMALIKIGVMVAAPHIALDDDFGVAPSTVKYKQDICAR